MIDIEKFFTDQLEAWPMCADNFAALEQVHTRPIDGCSPLKVQFNPARIVSTGAKMDKATLSARKCFLCEANRPPQQTGLDWGEYTILVNPYPIFHRHFTIPAKAHTPQLIDGRLGDMLRLAHELPGYTIFYNGAKCGASAPDHMHFQAVPSDCLPLWATVPPFPGERAVASGIKAFVIGYDYIPDAVAKAQAYLNSLSKDADSGEPMVNILARRGSMVIIPRRKHRPGNYGSGDGEILVSPASIDLAGVMITPLEKDFLSIDAEKARRILSEVCYTDI